MYRENYVEHFPLTYEIKPPYFKTIIIYIYCWWLILFIRYLSLKCKNWAHFNISVLLILFFVLTICIIWFYITISVRTNYCFVFIGSRWWNIVHSLWTATKAKTLNLPKIIHTLFTVLQALVFPEGNANLVLKYFITAHLKYVAYFLFFFFFFY